MFTDIFNAIKFTTYARTKDVIKTHMTAVECLSPLNTKSIFRI